MPRVQLEHDSLRIGRVSITFQRTLRIPDDGRTYPLPPGLGAFPIRRVRDFARRVPAAWREKGGYIIPMYQREALWMSFDGAYWRPNAVKIGVGGVNVVSGRAMDARLRARPQDYMVVPDQPWLDGINAGHGFIRQFVATPLGEGKTVEGQVTGEETEGGIQIRVFEPKPGRFPDRPPRMGRWADGARLCCASPVVAEMGLGAGGRMVQSIYPDPHGRDTWDETGATSVHVHVANSETWRAITGEAPPPSPISAHTYTEYGLPWFRLYDEHKGDVAPSDELAKVKSLAELERLAALDSLGAPLEVSPTQLITLG